MEGPDLIKEETKKPSVLRIEDIPKEHKAFANGLLGVSGVSTLEEARQADWKFDGAYLATEREPESTNYQVVETEAGVQKVEDSVERRCTLCHQELKEVHLVGINGQVVQMGGDCAAKLMRFIETGEIIAGDPRREILAEQSKILLEGAQYERGILEKEREALKWTDEEGYKKLKKITDGKIVASMMTWLVDHVEDDGVPEEVAYAIRSYDSIGMMPADKLAREVSEYYKSARKFLPDELLKDDEVRGLKYHPHKGLLRNVIKEGVVQNDLPQLRRIIEKGTEIKKQHSLRVLEEASQKKEDERREKGNRERVSEVVPRAQNEEIGFSEKANKILESVRQEGLIDRSEFSEFSDVFDRMGKISPYLDLEKSSVVVRYDAHLMSKESRLRTDSFHEFDEDYGEQVGYLYTLVKSQRKSDYSRYYSNANGRPYFVIIKEHEVEIKKIYPEFLVRRLNEWISLGVALDTKSIQDAIAELPMTECIVHKYSCAEVVVDKTIMQPVVLLEKGELTLVQAIEEGKVVEWSM